MNWLSHILNRNIPHSQTNKKTVASLSSNFINILNYNFLIHSHKVNKFEYARKFALVLNTNR